MKGMRGGRGGWGAVGGMDLDGVVGGCCELGRM